jgi:uncharacterized protein
MGKAQRAHRNLVRVESIRARPMTIDAHILVFVRAPEAGRVKTRLAAEIGEAAALEVYRQLAEHTLRAARGVAGAEVRVLFTPADAGEAVRGWLGGEARYEAQAEGDLGQRLEAAFEAAFADGARRVLVVGSDLPTLTPALLRHALAVLACNPAVLGPAHDGGYYLLGLRAPRPRLFRGMPWSTPAVFAETWRRLRAAGVEPVLLPTLRDVDYVSDLPATGEWGRYRRASAAGSAPA